MFNLLDASGGIGVTERMAYILRVRQLAVAIAKAWVGESEVRARTTPVTARHHDEREDHEDREQRMDPLSCFASCYRRAFVALRAIASCVIAVVA